MMPAAQVRVLLGEIFAYLADRPTVLPADWCEQELVFDEAGNRNGFSLLGREYLRDPLNDWADPEITDQVLVFGSQTGKTSTIMGGACWRIKHDPARIFWVMPTKEVVRKFAKTRWVKLLRRSTAMAALLSSAGRYDVNTLDQEIGDSAVDLVWSNSPSALSSVPAQVAILDELDKFPPATEEEAEAGNLVDQRTKNCPWPKRVRASTPTTTTGQIWQALQKTDCRRRFLPCLHCHKPLVLAWSKAYTIFKVTGVEAFVFWDAEARRPDGTWDLDRVRASAHYRCPHCGGRITEESKRVMDRSGKWEPTQPAAARWRGYHLPSLYSAAAECHVGHLAVRFLEEKRSLAGLRGFINGELAEALENQEDRGERVELITQVDAPPIGGLPILTVDHQMTGFRFWYVVRQWDQVMSRLLAYGHLDTWEQVREVQLNWKVPNHLVGIDSGHDATTVYKECLRWGVAMPQRGGSPRWVGWTPMKGAPKEMGWIDKKTKTRRPYGVQSASVAGIRVYLPLLMFYPEDMANILETLRTQESAVRWELSPDCGEDYYLHLDAEIRKEFLIQRRIVTRWTKRTRTWPDHLRDCEKMQIPMALTYGLASLGPVAKPRESEGS